MLKRTFVIALIVSVVVAACGGSPAVETELLVGELPDSEISVGEPSSEVDGPSTEPGEVNAGLDSASIPLPNGFPESFPLPEGALVFADYSMPQEKGDYQVYFELPGSYEETVAFFEAAFPDTGWEVQGTKDYSFGDTQSLEIRVAGYGFKGRVLILCCTGGMGLEVDLEPSS